MSQFNCPKCQAANRPSPGEIGCSACGFGKAASPPMPLEQQPIPEQPPQTEVSPPHGYKGKYLTEACN